MSELLESIVERAEASQAAAWREYVELVATDPTAARSDEERGDVAGRIAAAMATLGISAETLREHVAGLERWRAASRLAAEVPALRRAADEARDASAAARRRHRDELERIDAELAAAQRARAEADQALERATAAESDARQAADEYAFLIDRDDGRSPFHPAGRRALLAILQALDADHRRLGAAFPQDDKARIGRIVAQLRMTMPAGAFDEEMRRLNLRLFSTEIWL